MADTVTAAVSPLNCIWIEPGSRHSIDGFEYAVCQRIQGAERVVNETECAFCPSWAPRRATSRGSYVLPSAGSASTSDCVRHKTR